MSSVNVTRHDYKVYFALPKVMQINIIKFQIGWTMNSLVCGKNSLVCFFEIGLKLIEAKVPLWDSWEWFFCDSLFTQQVAGLGIRSGIMTKKLVSHRFFSVFPNGRFWDNADVASKKVERKQRALNMGNPSSKKR